MPLGDLWHDAKLVDAIYYVRGSKSLSIPNEEWRRVLPTPALKQTVAMPGYWRYAATDLGLAWGNP